MFIIPKHGLQIRDPHTFQIIPAEGKEVSDHDLFYHRLLNDGDVKLADDRESE